MQGIKWLQAKQALLGGGALPHCRGCCGNLHGGLGFAVAAVGTDGRHVGGMQKGDGVRGSER